MCGSADAGPGVLSLESMISTVTAERSRSWVLPVSTYTQNGTPKNWLTGQWCMVLHFGLHVFNIFCTLIFYRVLLRNIYLYFYHLSPDTQSPESNLCACTFVFVCEYTRVYACESECVFVLCNPPFPPDMTSPCCASLQRPN